MKKHIEIESWAIRVLEKVGKGLPIEDSAVELKADWIAPAKAARQIAAHANAARGGEILWLIGVDEKRGVVGADDLELSNWFAGVQSRFDGIAPGLQNLNISYGGKTVAALCFETSRLPFVVKNPAFGCTTGEGVEWEVPWREGAKTRTATRQDLLLLLSPLRTMPKLDLLDGEVTSVNDQRTAHGNAVLWVRLSFYVVPVGDSPVVFPFYKCGVAIVINGQSYTDTAAFSLKPSPTISGSEVYQRFRMHHPNRPVANVTVKGGHETIEATGDEICIRGPGKIELRAQCLVPSDVLKNAGQIQTKVQFVEAVNEQQVCVDCTLWHKSGRDDAIIWSHGD